MPAHLCRVLLAATLALSAMGAVWFSPGSLAPAVAPPAADQSCVPADAKDEANYATQPTVIRRSEPPGQAPNRAHYERHMHNPRYGR